MNSYHESYHHVIKNGHKKLSSEIVIGSEKQNKVVSGHESVSGDESMQ